MRNRNSGTQYISVAQILEKIDKRTTDYLEKQEPTRVSSPSIFYKIFITSNVLQNFQNFHNSNNNQYLIISSKESVYWVVITYSQSIRCTTPCGVRRE